MMAARSRTTRTAVGVIVVAAALLALICVIVAAVWLVLTLGGGLFPFTHTSPMHTIS